VEDPSDDFELLRDYVDARDCKSLASYAPANLKQRFTPEVAEEAQKVLKMTKVSLNLITLKESSFCVSY